MSSSILSAYFSHIELQIGNDPEFTRIFGAKVNAVPGSRYSECRGYASYRHVTLCILTEAGLKLAETILSRFPAYVLIMRNSLQTADGMRLIDGYPMRICGNPGTGFRNAYAHVSSDLVITRAKGVMHHDLSALIALTEREVQRHQSVRVTNAFAQAMVGIKHALLEHAKAWRAHSDFKAGLHLGLDIAFERIELRVLKGELKPEPTAQAVKPAAEPAPLAA